MTRVLHLLSQRPSLTGSGVTLDSLVREAASSGIEQAVVFGVPARSEPVRVGSLEPEAHYPLEFGTSTLPFPVPGMSDVMPYESTRFSEMDEVQLGQYVTRFTEHLERVRDQVQPDVVHAHHTWIVSALARDVFKSARLVLHGHGTDLRQMELCPHLREGVLQGCARADAYCVLHEEHREAYGRAFGVPAERIHTVGTGYREDLFRPAEHEGRDAVPNKVLYAGKISESKGLGALLQAHLALRTSRPDAELHVAGSGAGPEAERLRARMDQLGDSGVQVHGRLTQEELAALMRVTDVFVLPSYYEGLPLVLVEALACGMRVVSSDVPGVVEVLAPALRDSLSLVQRPPLKSVDEPEEHEVPAYAQRLAEALERSLAMPSLEVAELEARLAPFRWRAVFEKVRAVWQGS